MFNSNMEEFIEDHLSLDVNDYDVTEVPELIDVDENNLLRIGVYINDVELELLVDWCNTSLIEAINDCNSYKRKVLVINHIFFHFNKEIEMVDEEHEELFKRFYDNWCEIFKYHNLIK